jgi:hypothetical protein
MKRLSFSAAMLSLFLFGQCKRECANIKDGSVMLKTNEVNSLAYNGQDTILFLEDGMLKTFKSGAARQYFNTYKPNTDCSGSLQLEGNQILLKDSTLTIEIYHNHSVYSSDTTTSYFNISYRGRNFGFPYSSLIWPAAVSSMSINGKSYQNVFRKKFANDSFYYNKTNGIIRIKLESGHLLQLP